jgi:hypothetical protein
MNSYANYYAEYCTACGHAIEPAEQEWHRGLCHACYAKAAANVWGTASVFPNLANISNAILGDD